MAADILRLIHGLAGAEVIAGVGDPQRETAQSQVSAVCAELGVPYFQTPSINDPLIVEALKALNPTYLISANNFTIFRKSSLNIAKKGIINFHNGPLPRYGGLNVCSWMIINDETECGVTWHIVDEGIDTGPILAQRRFPIEANDRAITLIARCIREGVNLFADLLPKLLNDSVVTLAQEEGRLYYGKRDRPYDGFLPWWESARALDCLGRGLSFHPFQNDFFRPLLRVQDYDPVFAGEFIVLPGVKQTIGTVKLLSDHILIQGCQAEISFEEIYDACGKEIPLEVLVAKYGFINGALLARP
jgi:methionyl-tRNA formyltransferase